MITKFTKITSGLVSLNDEIDNDQKVRKVISVLLPSWEINSTTLKELNDKKKMELICLNGNLKIHEREKKARDENAPQMKKSLTFKSTPTISDDEDDDHKDDEDLSLVKNVRRTYNKAKFNNRRRWQGKEEKNIVCYNCWKPRHFNCLDIKRKPSTSKKSSKKMALKAT